MKSAALQAISVRIAEILCELAEMKRAYFVDGIERPMADRVELESELANLRLEKLKINSMTKARDMQVRQLRGAILKKRLEDMGYPTLVEECDKLAESQIPEVAV